MSAVLKFFVLTYLAAWAFFIPVAATMSATDAGTTVLVTLGAFTPSLVALWLTRRNEGAAGVQALVDRIFQWRVALRWYLFAAGYIVVIKLTVALIHRAATGAWPQFVEEPWYLIPVAIAFSTPFQAGEEIGWRGYALPRLAARFGLGRASILLGVIWACWHLPLFFVPGVDKYGQSFIVYALQVTALSVAMAWLYARTNGSLLLVMLLHAAVNNAKDIVPSAVPGATSLVGAMGTTGTFGLSASPVAWLTVAVLWMCAAYFLTRMPRSLS